MSLVNYQEEISVQEFVITPILRGSYREVIVSLYQNNNTVAYDGLTAATDIKFELFRGDFIKGVLVLSKTFILNPTEVLKNDASSIKVILPAADTLKLSMGEYIVVITIVESASVSLKTKGLLLIQ